MRITILFVNSLELTLNRVRTVTYTHQTVHIFKFVVKMLVVAMEITTLFTPIFTSDMYQTKTTRFISRSSLCMTSEEWTDSKTALAGATR